MSTSESTPTQRNDELRPQPVDENRDVQVHTYRPEPGEVPLTELEGEERSEAVRRAAARMMVQNRELMDRLSRR